MESPDGPHGCKKFKAYDFLIEKEQRGPAKTQIAMNDNVMEIVAKYLPSNDIKNLRTTSTTWNNGFSRTWKSNHHPISVNDDTSPILSPDSELENLTLVLAESENVPFSKYELRTGGGWPQNDPTIWNDRFQDFCRLLGDEITTLKLEWDNWLRENTLPVHQLRNIIFNELPNLQELILTPKFRAGNDIPAPHFLKPLPNLRKFSLEPSILFASDPLLLLCSQIFQQAEQLKEVRVDEHYSTSNRIMLPLVLGLCNSPTIGHLRSLRLSTVNLPVLKVLIQAGEMKLHLLQLHVKLDRFRDTGDDLEYANLFRKLLVSQAETLESLRFSIECEPPTSHDFIIPRLMKLKTLDVDGDYDGLLRIKYELSFENTLPTLNRLVQRFYQEFYFPEIIDVMAHNGVLEIVLFHFHMMKPKSFVSLSERFKNITRLWLGSFDGPELFDEASFPNNLFSFVGTDGNDSWKLWPKLKLLNGRPNIFSPESVVDTPCGKIYCF